MVRVGKMMPNTFSRSDMKMEKERRFRKKNLLGWNIELYCLFVRYEMNSNILYNLQFYFTSVPHQ